MKIVYCLKSTFNSGGMERIVIAKANQFAKAGNDVTIITTDQKNRKPFFSIDEKINCVDLAINYDELNNTSFAKKYFALKKKFKLHRKRLQEFLNTHRNDIIISTFGNEVNFVHKLKGSFKTVCEIHFSRYYRLQLQQSAFRKLVNRYLTFSYKPILKHYDAFVCLTNEDSKNWGTLRNLHTIPNFINHRSLSPAKLQNKRVISVGRLNYQKGYERLIRIWKRIVDKHPGWILDIYGGGELETELKNQISSLSLNNSVFIHKPVNNILDKLNEASIYVMTSRYEGLPMVLLEAMSCGLPIVSYDCQCGPRDLLENNTGILIKEDNETAFEDAVCKLIENSELRKEMGTASYDEAAKYLFPEIMKMWNDLFQNLLK